MASRFGVVTVGAGRAEADLAVRIQGKTAWRDFGPYRREVLTSGQLLFELTSKQGRKVDVWWSCVEPNVRKL